MVVGSGCGWEGKKIGTQETFDTGLSPVFNPTSIPDLAHMGQMGIPDICLLPSNSNSTAVRVALRLSLLQSSKDVKIFLKKIESNPYRMQRL